MAEHRGKPDISKNPDSRSVVKGTYDTLRYEKELMLRGLPKTLDLTTTLHVKMFEPIFFQGTAGAYRQAGAFLSSLGPGAADPSEIPRKMREYGQEADNRLAKIRKGYEQVGDVLDVAFWSHYQVASIHPFPDGNGRVARRVMNVMLRKFGIKPVNINPNNHDKYIDALDKASSREDLDYQHLFLAKQLLSEYGNVTRGADYLIKCQIEAYVAKIEDKYAAKYG